MALGATFRQSVTVALDRHLSSAEQGRRVAAVARGALDELVRSGAASPVYTRFVDGRTGVLEEGVKLDGGTIAYTVQQHRRRRGVRLGLCRRAVAASVGPLQGIMVHRGGRAGLDPAARRDPGRVAGHSDQPGAVCPQDRHRRDADVGPAGHCRGDPAGAATSLSRAAGGPHFVKIPGGRDGRGGTVPYVLKGRGRESGLMFSAKEGWGGRHAPRPARAKDRQAGGTLTYPAVVMSERVR
jgi:hypothetical protein